MKYFPSIIICMTVTAILLNGCIPDVQAIIRKSRTWARGREETEEAKLAKMTVDERYNYFIGEGDKHRTRRSMRYAEKYYKKARRERHTAEIEMRFATLHKGKSNLEYAAKYFIKAIEIDPNVLDARIGLAKFCLHSRHNKVGDFRSPDPQTALKLLEEEDALQPGHPEVASLMQEAKQRIEAIKRRQEEEKAAEEKRLAEERRALEQKAKLQQQIWEVAKVQCRLITFETLGKSFGHEYAEAMASGIYQAALLKCKNVSSSTRYVNSTDFYLVDGAGRQYAVDSKGSYYYAINKENNYRTPEYLQMHPNVVTYIALVFDIPPEIITDPKLQLDFATARFQLVFPE